MAIARARSLHEERSMFDRSRSSSAVLCSIVLFVSACATGDAGEPELYQCEPVPKDHPDRDSLAAIDAMGLCGSSAVDIGDAYLVEGDIRVLKSVLADKQARHSSLVSTANIRSVSVGVDGGIPSDGGVDDWREAVQAAIGVWNAEPFNLVRLEYTSGTSADIMFLSDADRPDGFLLDHEAARAEFPSNGNPGGAIFVNLDLTYMDQFNFPLTHGQKVFLAVHEIGHNIGFRHTNWRIWDQNDAPAIDIPGTPTVDSASVMNAGTAGREFNGFSANDQLAIRLVYPEIVTMMVEFTGCTSGTPRLAATWGGTLVQPTIEWQLERYTSGTWSQVYRGTAQTRTFNVPAGTSLKLRVRGRSAEGWSLHRSVTRTAPSCNTLPQ